MSQKVLEMTTIGLNALFGPLYNILKYLNKLDWRNFGDCLR